MKSRMKRMANGECLISNNEAILQHFVIRRFQFKLPKVCEIRN
jgi:hypothetical protein